MAYTWLLLKELKCTQKVNFPAACAMAWFSGRLPQFSSLTDQISSFTKEVLTETTEEVEGKSVVVAEADTFYLMHTQ